MANVDDIAPMAAEISVDAELITRALVAATGDGRLRDADVVVGADGIWSSTRQALDPFRRDRPTPG